MDFFFFFKTELQILSIISGQIVELEIKTSCEDYAGTSDALQFAFCQNDQCCSTNGLGLNNGNIFKTIRFIAFKTKQDRRYSNPKAHNGKKIKKIVKNYNKNFVKKIHKVFRQKNCKKKKIHNKMRQKNS